jgi:hypothetical protein
LTEPRNNAPKTRLVAKTKPPKVVLEIKDGNEEDGLIARKIVLNQDAIPGKGEDAILLLMAKQVLDATKISHHAADEATERYNAVVAALHDIAPSGALEAMLATQLVAAHMATMDCYAHLTKTGERPTHEYHLNQVNKLSRTFVALLDALNRHRGKTGQQKVTVEHVHVHRGGQAIVGHVGHPGGGEQAKLNGITPCGNG